MEDEEDEGNGRFSRQVSERSLSRPSTPKWWRPNYPPETYEWEEMRRKRRQGGYPWTHLDKNPRDKEQGDHIYETVSPPDLYSSGLVGGDPETSSLDRHLNFHIPPELDIVSSEGLDGLDLPDSHDFGLDGEKEWSLFYEDEKRESKSPSKLFAGLRTELRRVGEKSSIRPLRQGMCSSPVDPEVQLDESNHPLEIGEDEEETLPVEMEMEESPQKESKVKSRPGWRFGKISLPTPPKFPKWKGIQLLKKKGKNGQKTKGNQEHDKETDEEVTEEPIPSSSKQKLKIQFDDSLDLSLRPPSPKTPQMDVKFKLNVPLPPESVAEEENLEELNEGIKLEEERMRQEAKRLKMEKVQREEEKKAEIKRIKMEEKLVKETEKAELKRIKEEEKLMKQKEEAEVKKQKQEEAEKLRQEKLKVEADAKLLKELEAEEAELMKQLEIEELKLKKANEEKEKRRKEEEEKRNVAESSKKSPSELKLDKLEAEIMESILKEEEIPKTPKSSRIESFKQRLSEINCSKRFKRKTHPHLAPQSPPTFKFTQSPQQELASSYRQEIQERMDTMEKSHIAPQPHILLTQPSVEFESETHAQWTPPTPTSAQGPLEDEEDEEEEGKKRGRKRPIGLKLKGFGQRSKSVAQQTSKNLKQGVSGFGKKVSAKYAEALKEMRAQEAARKEQEAARREQEAAKKAAQEERKNSNSAPSTPNVFRFKRKFKKQTDENEAPRQVSPPVIVAAERKKGGKKEIATSYENVEFKVDRSILLGRADRDWESPRHLPSRDASEDRNASRQEVSSGCESPQGSSVTSYSVHAHVQRTRGQGVLEEIDSDEFFLRERGLSEGEDAIEVNRFLVNELREAFRPSHVNALSGYDVPPPSRPRRSTRKKPPQAPFQTFPPERPKRKHPPHFVSAYVESLDNENSDEDEEEDEKGEPLFPFPSDSENEDEKEEDEEGMRRLMAELDKIEEDGSYEEVKKSSPPPSRPMRSKKEKSPQPTNKFTPLDSMEDEEMHKLTQELMEIRNSGQSPIPPKRNSRKNLLKSQESFNQSVEGNKEIELHFVDDWEIEGDGQVSKEPPRSKIEEFDDYLDDEGSGYAHVEKSPPQSPPVTFPRRKRKQKHSGREGNSLKRKSREMAPPATLIFSLPRFTPRTFHIVPPSRPHRTYSALRPKRPPRKSRGKMDENMRPKGRVMRDRPLPPPPRPPRPLILHEMNNLDQENLERSLGVRHYANWEDEEETDGATQRAVVEETCTAKNITLLGEAEDVNVGIQTDPLSEEDFDYNNPIGSFEEEEVERNHKLADSVDEFCLEKKIEEEVFDSEDVGRFPREIHQPPPNILQPVSDDLERASMSPLEGSTQIIFPTRLHLDELEVDFLRVNELSARTVTMDHIHTPHLGVDNLESRGSLSVPSLHTSRISTDNLVGPGDVPFPSTPPASFYNLRTSSHGRPGEEEGDPPLEPIGLRSLPPPSQVDEDDVLDLGMRLGRSLVRSGLRAIQAAMEFLESALPVDPESEQKQRTHLQVMLCVLLLLITGIFLLTRGETKHPHWDFYLPPTDI